MRVAFDVGPLTAQPTGVGLFASSMANALAGRLGRESLVLIGRREGLDGLPHDVPSTPLAGGSYIAWLQTRAARDIRRTGSDIGHFANGLAPVIRAGRTVLSVQDVSVIRHWRTHPALRLLRVPLAMLSPHLADLVLVPSRATADELVRLTGTKASKIELIPYGPQDRIAPPGEPAIAETLQRHGLSSRGFVLALGTVEPRKNHVRLVEAFELASRDGTIRSDMVLVIAGQAGWHAEPILERIRQSPVADRIKLPGYVSSQDLAALLREAAAVAYVSLYEGFGLPVVEAMAAGAPTVTSNVSSMLEVAGDAGFLIDPTSVADIARGLQEALEAGDTDRAGVAARGNAQAAKFTWELGADAAIELYRTRLGS